MADKIQFKFDIEKVLHILSDSIYDSPQSLLRENVQNSYDAILIRSHVDASFAGKGRIDVCIDGLSLTVSDNGIGMTRQNLDDNYWTAGSSGKNTKEAQDSGVVGTFGIGAMANFGVCETLEVITRYFKNEDPLTLTSRVTRENLLHGDHCIDIAENQFVLPEPGTKVNVTLLPEYAVTETQIIDYLTPYVQYLSVPVYVNGKCISQKQYILQPERGNNTLYSEGRSTRNGISFSYRLSFFKGTNQLPVIYISDLNYNGHKIEGDMLFSRKLTSIFGYRNGFGLANIPLATNFNLGGIVNILELVPTAGRDAISRDSIDLVSRFLAEVEYLYANVLSCYDEADSNREFLQYARRFGLYNLCGNVTISVAKGKSKIKLKDLSNDFGGKSLFYYLGNDETIISNYSDDNSWLLMPSDDSNRRQIQIHYLRNSSVQQVSDSPQAFKVYSDSELEAYEFAIAYRIENVIKEDYLFSSCKVYFSELSHGLTSMVTMDGGTLVIYISRTMSGLDYLYKIYSENYAVLEPMVKDLVRTQMYPKFAPYIPSSNRGGADMLYRMLVQSKEEWSVESSEIGAVETIWDAFKKGKANIDDVAAVVNQASKMHAQTVEADAIGNISDVIGDATIQNVAERLTTSQNVILSPMPPIMRMDKDVNKLKILRSDTDEHRINGYSSFLSVTDSMRDFALDFFLQPHTTRVIWSMHKIIYIFTHASGELSLYYDMDLKHNLDSNRTGGKEIMTSTIITKDKVFVPIVDELADYFNINQGSLKFLVRFNKLLSDVGK